MNLHVSRSLGLARSQEPLGSEDLTVLSTHTNDDVMGFLFQVECIAKHKFLGFLLLLFFNIGKQFYKSFITKFLQSGVGFNIAFLT